jgi:secreted PhoX family phosphatase
MKSKQARPRQALVTDVSWKLHQAVMQHFHNQTLADAMRRTGMDQTYGGEYESSAGAVTLLGLPALRANATGDDLRGFPGMPVAVNDALKVPPDYETQVLYRWGDAVGSQPDALAFRSDDSDSRGERALQAGVNRNGMAFLLVDGNPRHGLLASNHEQSHNGLPYSDGVQTWSINRPDKSKAPRSASVIEIVERMGKWCVLPRSRHAQHMTTSTLTGIRRPVPGPAQRQTSANASACEVTGFAFTPDRRFLFVNVQYMDKRVRARSEPTKRQIIGNWPDDSGGGRLRFAAMVIRRKSGGAVGTLFPEIQAGSQARLHS